MDSKRRSSSILCSRPERSFSSWARVRLRSLLTENGSADGDSFDLFSGTKPYVIMVVGVNGVGKTTTIGKLAHRFRQAGKSVVLGAADTFRAAAVEQLEIWSERVGS